MPRPTLLLEVALGLGALAVWALAFRHLMGFRRHWVSKPDENLPKAWAHARKAGALGIAFLVIILALAIVGFKTGDLG